MKSPEEVYKKMKADYEAKIEHIEHEKELLYAEVQVLKEKLLSKERFNIHDKI